MKKNLSFTWNIDDYPINFPVELRLIYEKTYIKIENFIQIGMIKLVKSIKKILIGGYLFHLSEIHTSMIFLTTRQF